MDITHHAEAIAAISAACLDLIEKLPDTDIVREIKGLLEEQFDIIDCLGQTRHFGSDSLDWVIQKCNNIITPTEDLA